MRYVGNIFIKRGDISTQEPDVRGYLLHYIANNMSDKKAKEDPKRMENLVKAKLEILNKGIKKYPFGAFAGLIEEEIAKLSGTSGNSTSIQAVKESVQVYESPDVNSLVVDTIEAGTALAIEEKSDVGGVEWVRISNPCVGWVLASQASQ